MAIPLTFLVYGTPAIAMCAREWAGELSRPVLLDGFSSSDEGFEGKSGVQRHFRSPLVVLFR